MPHSRDEVLRRLNGDDDRGIVIVIAMGLALAWCGRLIDAAGWPEIGNRIDLYAHFGIAWAVMSQIAGSVNRVAGKILDAAVLVVSVVREAVIERSAP